MRRDKSMKDHAFRSDFGSVALGLEIYPTGLRQMSWMGVQGHILVKKNIKISKPWSRKQDVLYKSNDRCLGFLMI